MCDDHRTIFYTNSSFYVLGIYCNWLESTVSFVVENLYLFPHLDTVFFPSGKPKTEFQFTVSLSGSSRIMFTFSSLIVSDFLHQTVSGVLRLLSRGTHANILRLVPWALPTHCRSCDACQGYIKPDIRVEATLIWHNEGISLLSLIKLLKPTLLRKLPCQNWCNIGNKDLSMNQQGLRSNVPLCAWSLDLLVFEPVS